MDALKELIEKYVPAPVRLALYALAGLALIAFGAWQASDGNWAAAAVAVMTALVNGLAAAKTEDTTKDVTWP